MRRGAGRWPRLLAAALALALLGLLALSVPVPPGRAVLVVPKDGPPRLRRGPTVVLRNPVSTRILSLDLDSRSVEDSWIVGPSGETVRLRLRVMARPDPEGRPEHLLAIARGATASLSHAVADARHDLETSRPAGGPADTAAERARPALARALRAASWIPEELEVIPAEGPTVPPRHDTGLRVLLVGIDSADWDRAGPLIAAGQLPNLARLREKGAWTALGSDAPSLSPLLWTTAATGRPPDEHGIIDFVMLDPATGAQVPISSRFRRVKAFWNILSEAGMSVAVVGWWATWPAEPVEGVMVSDRVSYSLFRYDGREDRRGATYPESYYPTAASLRVEPWEITHEQVRPFARISAAEFERSSDRLRTAEGLLLEDHLDSLRRTLASTLTYHRIALDLLRRGQPRLLAVYYQGLDEVNHRFAHLAPPPHPLAEPGERARYGGAVDAFYELQDGLLGELLAGAADDTTVMVLSDHGFANAAERPREFPPYVEAGRPGRWHTPDGIWILSGPGVQPGRLADPVRLVQITPTLLRLLGLPLADDMRGNPVDSALLPAFRDAHAVVRIPSYEVGDRARSAAAVSGGPAADEMLARLRSLGYLAAPGADGEGPERGAGGTTATYHSNLGVIHLGRGALDAAREAFGQALLRSPGNLNARGGLIQIDILEGEPERALESTLRLFEETRGFDPVFYYIAAQLFERTGRQEEGLELLRDLAERQPEVSQLHTGLGILLHGIGSPGEAAREFRLALDRKPDALFALQELFLLEMPDGDLPGLLRWLSAAIELSPGSVMPYNWRGLVLRRQGQPAAAEESFRAALAIDPASVRSLVNLSSLLVDSDRAKEAIPLLRRARAADPEALEAWINLVVALGRAGQLEEARAEFEAAGGTGRGSTELLNAMAFSHYLNDHPSRARALLEHSLSIDPTQPDARRLLDRLGDVP